MAVFTKQILGGSTNGRPIEITATGSPGTTLHTATSTASQLDEVWLWAVNHGTAQEDLVIEAGGTASGDQIPAGIPPQQGAVLVMAGQIFSGGVELAAYTTTASGVSIFGFVNNIDQA